MNSVVESILDPVIHGRLYQNIEEIASTAGVPVSMIHQSASLWLSESELEWLREFKKRRAMGDIGWFFSGRKEPSVEIKMMAIAAALVRNFIDARVVPVSDLLSSEPKDLGLNCSVLLIPNFYVSSDGKPFASWQLQQLHSLLLKRFVEQKVTILYVQSLDKLSLHYGDGISSHLKQNYNCLGN